MVTEFLAGTWKYHQDAKSLNQLTTHLLPYRLNNHPLQALDIKVMTRNCGCWETQRLLGEGAVADEEEAGSSKHRESAYRFG
jgi:hypothetical protein